MATPKTSTPKKPKGAELQRWAELERKRLKAQRELAAIKSEQKELADAFFAWVRADKKRSLGVKVCDFVLRAVSARRTVSWKDEYVKLQGSEEAARLVNEAGSYLKLAIEGTE